MSTILLVWGIKRPWMLSCTFASFMICDLFLASAFPPSATVSSRLPDLMEGNVNIFIVTHGVYDKRKILLYKLMQPNERFHSHFRTFFIAIWQIWLFPLAFHL